MTWIFAMIIIWAFQSKPRSYYASQYRRSAKIACESDVLLRVWSIRVSGVTAPIGAPITRVAYAAALVLRVVQALPS